MSRSQQPVVLIVEDERDLASLFAEWLSKAYTVRTAHDGTEAIERYDEDVAVVLLDRRLPGRSGDEIFEEIREETRSCRVAMVTAIEPDFDIIEIGFDDYVLKPVSEDELHAVVERLLRWRTYDREIRRHYALASMRALLEATKEPAELAASEEYAELEERLFATRRRVDAALRALDRDEFDVLFRGLDEPRRVNG